LATIKARRQANGSIRYTAIVRERVGKTIVHREAKTFTHRTAALSWARCREVELENPTALTRKQHSTVTLAELVRWYIETFEASSWLNPKYLGATRSSGILASPNSANNFSSTTRGSV